MGRSRCNSGIGAVVDSSSRPRMDTSKCQFSPGRIIRPIILANSSICVSTGYRSRLSWAGRNGGTRRGGAATPVGQRFQPVLATDGKVGERRKWEMARCVRILCRKCAIPDGCSQTRSETSGIQSSRVQLLASSNMLKAVGCGACLADLG